MQTPFRFTFQKKIKNISNKEILNNFKVAFEKSYCDNVEILNDSKLIVENELFRIKPDLNWNLWGGIGKAEVSISNNLDNEVKDVYYQIDFTRLIISILASFIFFSVFFLIFIFNGSRKLDESPFLLLLLLLFLIVGVFSLTIMLIRHWSVFRRIIKNDPDYFNYYDWPSILNKKTNEELYRISVDTQQSEAISSLAKDILAKRNFKVENKELHKSEN